LIVPGLLNEADAGAIAGLVAPRPQLVCIGEADALTPPLAVERAWDELSAAYGRLGGVLENVSEPGVGHRETLRMREAALAFFATHL
jgi:hypothetical protein